ncbi:hypothetical protein EVG20_g11280 [Dentipellis fragilis]|uniref:Ketoreductase domain-containing protein n=1 Tax=Dentipellis fragilis TaxID=205917 RepID=A0A4Y9XND5_9AGAM|nr:hypothetical protein EVG20_g11280 [Dentipellis fragilis]
MTRPQATGEKVWLITGAASGLGASLVEAVLARGDKVIATARPASREKLRAVIDALPPRDRESNRIRPLDLDVTDTAESIRANMKTAIALWGRVDVLVNNAGTVVGGVTEEEGAEAFLEQFKTNVFGVINATNAVLPHMRERRDGTVVIIGSRSAWANIPGVAQYSASKAAIHSYADTLAGELRHLNIRVLPVAPAAFRTQGFTAPTPLGQPIADYDPLRTQLAEVVKKRILENPEVGDPRKGMEILVDVVRGEGRAAGREWPSLLFLGAEAQKQIRTKSAMWELNLQAWTDVGCDVLEERPSN